MKRWVPAVPALSDKVLSFALLLLARLEVAPPEVVVPEEPTPEVASDAMEGVVETSPAEKIPGPAPYAKVLNGQVVDNLPPPSTAQEVVQHVELYFALCTKSPDLIIR